MLPEDFFSLSLSAADAEDVDVEVGLFSFVEVELRSVDAIKSKRFSVQLISNYLYYMKKK